MPRPPLRLLQAAFFAAALIAFTAAIWPSPVTPEASNADKALHFTTFYVLQLMALAAFPRARLVGLIAALGLFGGGIEVVQGMVGRDRSAWDWIADMLGILAATAPLLPGAWRRSR